VRDLGQNLARSARRFSEASRESARFCRRAVFARALPAQKPAAKPQGANLRFAQVRAARRLPRK